MHKSFFIDNLKRILATTGVLLSAYAGATLGAICIFVMTGCSCTVAGTSASGTGRTAGSSGTKPVKLVSWNVETFFDARTDGTEYAEFTGSSSTWSADKYKDRLKRLADYMKKQNADIYCFMEIENEAVVMDISNQLQGSDSRGTKWQYAAFGKEPGSAIGCAVFSKFPLEKITLHQIDYRVSLPAPAFESREPGTKLTPPEMRPLLELRLQDGALALFVCHWKSKSGGEAESAVWRACQEALLAERMKKALAEGAAVLACGDFNRGLAEFMWSYQGGSVELRTFSDTVTAASPWFASTQPGSYLYHGEWNRLDHIFTAGDIRLLTFSTDTDNGLTTEDGAPFGYDVFSGTGWSDHLPLICTFTMSGQ